MTPYGAVGAMQLPSVIVAAKALMGRPIHSLQTVNPTSTAVAGLSGSAIGAIVVGAVIGEAAVIALLAIATLAAMWFFGVYGLHTVYHVYLYSEWLQ